MYLQIHIYQAIILHLEFETDACGIVINARRLRLQNADKSSLIYAHAHTSPIHYCN